MEVVALHKPSAQATLVVTGWGRGGGTGTICLWQGVLIRTQRPPECVVRLMWQVSEFEFLRILMTLVDKMGWKGWQVGLCSRLPPHDSHEEETLPPPVATVPEPAISPMPLCP